MVGREARPGSQQPGGCLRAELADRHNVGAGNGGDVARGDQHPARRLGLGEARHVRLVPHVVQHEQVLVLGEHAAQPRPPLRHVGDRPAIAQGGGKAGLQLQQRPVRASVQLIGWPGRSLAVGVKCSLRNRANWPTGGQHE
jgi:hypothetical protein